MPGEVTRLEVTTELKACDVRRHLAVISADIEGAIKGSYPNIDGGTAHHVEQLIELAEWFIEAAEERARLKVPYTCRGCGITIPSGTGLEKDGKLRPLCPVCQIHEIGEKP